MKTVMTVICGKDAILEDVPVVVLPRVGETLRIRDWHCKVLKIEHSLSPIPEVHTIKIFVRNFRPLKF
jgi:hypothetical protein